MSVLLSFVEKRNTQENSRSPRHRPFELLISGTDPGAPSPQSTLPIIEKWFVTLPYLQSTQNQKGLSRLQSRTRLKVTVKLNFQRSLVHAEPRLFSVAEPDIHTQCES